MVTVIKGKPRNSTPPEIADAVRNAVMLGKEIFYYTDVKEVASALANVNVGDVTKFDTANLLLAIISVSDKANLIAIDSIDSISKINVSIIPHLICVFVDLSELYSVDFVLSTNMDFCLDEKKGLTLVNFQTSPRFPNTLAIDGVLLHLTVDPASRVLYCSDRNSAIANHMPDHYMQPHFDCDFITFEKEDARQLYTYFDGMMSTTGKTIEELFGAKFRQAWAHLRRVVLGLFYDDVKSESCAALTKESVFGDSFDPVIIKNGVGFKLTVDSYCRIIYYTGPGQYRRNDLDVKQDVTCANCDFITLEREDAKALYVCIQDIIADDGNGEIPLPGTFDQVSWKRLQEHLSGKLCR